MIDHQHAEDSIRVLPEYLEKMLSERDQAFNRLPTGKILEDFHNNKAAIFVDRSMALSAARSGVPVSNLAKFFSLAFPILVIAIPVLFFATSWQIAAIALLGAIVAFRAGRHFTVADVREFALKEERALRKMMEHGVVYFELV